MASEPVELNKMKIDSEAGTGYYQLTENPVMYTIDLDDLAIADYDEQGKVVGVEFLDAKKGERELEKYLELARRTTGGKATRRPKPPSA